MPTSQIKLPSMVSGQVLIGTDSAAAIVYGLGGCKSAADERPETNWAGGADFREPPCGLAGVASNQTSFYERHALHRCAPEIMAPEDAPQACDTVCALRRGMDGQIHHETAKHSWMARPRREDADA